MLFNTSTPGTPSFSLGPLVVDRHLSWGAAVGDLDNDDDIDLFISGGGNEDDEYDLLMVNQLQETGEATFLDASRASGTWGMAHPETGEVRPRPSAGAQFVDVDNDGFLDIFVNTNIVPAGAVRGFLANPVPGVGQNALWHYEALGGLRGYRDRAIAYGLEHLGSSQHSVFLDWDNDGDLDLYENNRPGFENVTAQMGLAGNDLQFPYESFVAAASDLNHDGFEDLVVFVRAWERHPDSPYKDGHLLLLNVEGRGFVEVAAVAGINEPFINWSENTFRDHTGGGAMGCQIGDVNADGIADVFVGQGGPTSGTTNIFFLSTGLVEHDIAGIGTVLVPTYAHRSDLIDFEAPRGDIVAQVPPYPYRTHGVSIVDVDGDGLQEIAVRNGGPAIRSEAVAEPGRLFQFTLAEAPRFLSVSLLGDGVKVNRSAIGAKVALTVVRDADGATWTLTRWVRSTNGFSGNNGLHLYFGLADADHIAALTVTWPGGESDALAPPGIGDRVQIVRTLSGDVTLRDRN